MARAGLSPVMVGRARELGRLRTLASAGGEPRVALLRGEAGVGKTRLIQEFVSGLPPEVMVFAAQAEQGAMGRPYQLLLEAVAPTVGAWTRVPLELRRWEDPLGVVLGPIAPQLAAFDRGYAADELARAGIELMRHLLATGNGVLVFEDLHWADAESLGLFQRLSVTPALPVLLVGSYRAEDLDRRHVTDLVAAVERHRQVANIDLDRLTTEEVGDLVGVVTGDVSYAAAVALHRRTGGNPFFLEELLLAAGDAPAEALAEMPLPATLTEAVLRHLEGLSAEQRQVVDAAAVLGQRLNFDWLASVIGLGEEVLVDVLRELVTRGLMIEDDADVFSFRHALTREAVAGRLLGRERRRLHEKSLAALLEVGSDDWAALAHHAAGAGRMEEMVAAAKQGAAQYLRTGATYQALRLAELALTAADADLEVLELAARAAWSVGLPSSALERAEQWRRLAAESPDPSDLTRALRLLARLRWESGDAAGHRAAVEAAQVAADALPPGEERAWVANLLAESAMLNGRNQEAVEWADKALIAAGPNPTPSLRAAILVNKGSALHEVPGRADEGEQLLLEGRADAMAGEDYVSALRASNNLIFHVFATWPPEQIDGLLSQMAVCIERGGRQDWLGTWHQLRATFLAHVLGDLAGARQEVERASAGVGPSKRPWVAILDAELALEAGDIRRARVLLAPIAGQVRSFANEPNGLSLTLSMQTRVEARAGDLAAVGDTLEHLAGVIAGLDGRERRWLCDSWHHSLVAALNAGLPPSRARDLLSRLDPPVLPEGRFSDPCWPDHLAGALAEAEGRTEDALAGYRAATADRGWRRSPAAAADAHVGAARCLLDLERLDEARQAARAAAALLERWPGWRQADAQSLLRRVGGRRPAASGPGPLTGREVEVAILVAEGLSNGEIAARLYISTKTASVHVSNILRKLGMSGRAEVAAWVVRQHLDA